MVAVMISKWIGDAFIKDGMYPIPLCVFVHAHAFMLVCMLAHTSWNVSMMLLAIGSSTNSASWGRIINKCRIPIKKIMG